MIKYIGSKRVLVPTILDIVGSLPEVQSVLDLFSGTSRVGHALKARGYSVLANDWMAYAHVLATCHVQAEAREVGPLAADFLRHLSSLEGCEGYFTQTFCRDSRFFLPKNGRRVDAIREEIDAQAPDPMVRAVALTSLMEAADRVDSTTGVQMAYLKNWAPRAFKDMELRMPALLDAAPGQRCAAFRHEAQDAAKQLKADLAYIDPPYNQHSYLGNYHIWETLVRWDRPKAYGKACKRVDCRTKKSDFNSRPRFHEAFARLVSRIRADFLLVSFNNEGYLTRDEMKEILSSRGNVHVIEKDHKRYVGARIGIHNPQGRPVGKVSHLRNREYLYLVVPEGYPWSATAATDANLPLFARSDEDQPGFAARGAD